MARLPRARRLAVVLISQPEDVAAAVLVVAVLVIVFVAFVAAMILTR